AGFHSRMRPSGSATTTASPSAATSVAGSTSMPPFYGADPVLRWARGAPARRPRGPAAARARRRLVLGPGAGVRRRGPGARGGVPATLRAGHDAGRRRRGRRRPAARAERGGAGRGGRRARRAGPRGRGGRDVHLLAHAARPGRGRAAADARVLLGRHPQRRRRRDAPGARGREGLPRPGRLPAPHLVPPGPALVAPDPGPRRVRDGAPLGLV